MRDEITPTVDYNYWLRRLDTQLIKPSNKNSVSPQSCYANENNVIFFNFGDYCNKQSNVTFLPRFWYSIIGLGVESSSIAKA